MNKLNILDDLLEKLKSEELIWILIPCDNLTDAENLACELGKKNIRWSLHLHNTNPPPHRWNTFQKDTLYVIQRSSLNRYIKFNATHIADLEFYEHEKHVLLHPHAVIQPKL